MLLFAIYSLISLFDILVAQIIYPLSQLNLPPLINCNNGEIIIGWPLNITQDGACSIQDFNLSSDGFYLYTLIFANITTDMYVYIDGVQYFYNLRSQVNSSLSVNVLHYRNQSNQQIASIDVIPIQGSILLKRILIQIAYNTSQGIIYTQSLSSVNIDDLQIKIQSLIVQDSLLEFQLAYNQSLLQFTQPFAMKNTDQMQLEIVNDTLICKANLTTNDLANSSLFSDIYNITLQFSAELLGQLFAQNQSIFIKSYIIQVFDTQSYDNEILDSTKPLIYTNTYLINAGELQQIIQVQDMQNHCHWSLNTPNITLYGTTSIYYIIPYQMTNSCQWSINLPENMEEQQYNLTFETQIYDTNFGIEKTFQLNFAQDQTIEHVQYAIIVYIICMVCSFTLMIPCLIFIQRTKINYPQEESQYQQFLYSCFNEALSPTQILEETQTQFEFNRPTEEQFNQGQTSTRPFNSNQLQINTPQVENNIQSLISSTFNNRQPQSNLLENQGQHQQLSNEFQQVSEESPCFQPIKSSTHQQQTQMQKKSHERIFKLGIDIPLKTQNQNLKIETRSQFQPIPDNSPISGSSDMQNQFFHSQSRIMMNLSGISPLISHHQNGTPQINDRLGFI